MGAPQIIWCCLVAFLLLGTARLHGQPRKDKWNFWIQLVASSLGFGLLYWGGFFG